MPYSAQILVGFRGIDRMYDLRFGPKATGLGAGQSIRLLPEDDRTSHPEVFDSLEAQFDDAGRCVKAFDKIKIPAPRSGIYRGFSVTDLGRVLRTFVRGSGCEPPRPGAWVYVLSDQQEKGKLALVHILRFHEGGKHTQCDLDEPEKALDGQPKDTGLVLWEVLLGTPVRNCAFLSPMPLPAETVKALRNPASDEDKELLARALARASWVNDPFVCDVVHGASSHRPATKQADQAAKDGAAEVGERVLYLMNPFHEAGERIHAFHAALDRALAAQVEAAKDERYLLAKRIQSAILCNERLAALVQPALNGEVDTTEGPISFFWAVAEERVADLLRWGGYRYEPAGWIGFDGSDGKMTWKIEATRDGYKATALDYQLAPEQRLAGNWLSAAMLEGEQSAGVWEQLVKEQRDDFHEGLSQTELGRRFLKKQADRIAGDEPVKPGSDDGLLGPLFTKTRKNAINLAQRGWSGVFQNVLPFLYLRWGKMTFESFADFVEHRTGGSLVRFGAQSTLAEYRAMAKEHRRSLSTASIVLGKGKPPKDAFRKWHQDGKTAVAPWMVVFKTVLLYESLEEARKKKDAWGVMSFFANAASTADTVLDLTMQLVAPDRQLRKWIEAKSLRDYKVLFQGRVAGQPIHYAGYARLRFLGTFASALDLILAIRSVSSERYPGVRTGRLLRALGAAILLAGAVTAETGIGVGLALLGLGLQMAGDWVAYLREPLRVFLLKSPWGKEGNKTPTVGGIGALIGELDAILYDYSWDVVPQPVPAEGKVRFTILVRPARGTPLLPREARLEIALTLGRETRPPQSTTVTTRVGFEYLHQSDTWTILLAEVPWA